MCTLSCVLVHIQIVKDNQHEELNFVDLIVMTRKGIFVCWPEDRAGNVLNGNIWPKGTQTYNWKGKWSRFVDIYNHRQISAL